MLLQGQTSEYSLPELFKFIKDSQQSGRLSLKTLFGRDLEGDPHYFWFENGNLVATSQRLDGLGLINFLQSRCLIKGSILPRLLRKCPSKVALGAYLKAQTILTVRQLQSLFSSQVLNSTCVLLQSPNVRFAFYPDYPFPYLEMTGVKIQATDITLPSLRMIKSWSTLIEKLPELDSGLKAAEGNVPRYRLNSQEKMVLSLAESGKSLADIAKAMPLPKLDVQKIGFRLIFVGLASEVPMVNFMRSHNTRKRPAPAKVSQTFLNKLSNYLQTTADTGQSAVSSPVVSEPIARETVRKQSYTRSHQVAPVVVSRFSQSALEEKRKSLALPAVR